MTRRPSLFFTIFAFAALVSALCGPAFGQEKALIGARHPAISPDGKQIAFSYMGDIWLVPSDGGRAFRLTDHVAYEREPVWSPDGQWLAFTSNRNGNNDVFHRPVLRAGRRSSSPSIRATIWPRISRPTANSSSSVRAGPLPPACIRFRSTGGTELPVLETYWNCAYHGRISPDGKTLLFSRGSENSYWWRTRLSRGQYGEAVDGRPPDRRREIDRRRCGQLVLAGLAARRNAASISSATGSGDLQHLDGGRRRLRGQAGHQVRQGRRPLDVRGGQAPWPAYERDFGIWVTNLADRRYRARVPIEAPAETKDNRTFFVENAPVSEFRVSPGREEDRRRRPGRDLRPVDRRRLRPERHQLALAGAEASIGTRTAGTSSMSPTPGPTPTFTPSRRSATKNPAA